MTTKPRFRLTPEQYERLTMPLDANRVGKNPKGFSHLEAWDVRRWLIRVFGFGSFDIETIALDLVKEIEHPTRRRKNKQGEEYGEPYTPWTVVYRAQVRLTVYDQFGGKVVLEDGACGDSTNQPSLGDCHDNASKTALSQALKRCAVNLGDCFGLSLYNNGKVGAVVARSLVAPDAAPGAAELPAEDEPVMPEPGTEQRGEPVPAEDRIDEQGGWQGIADAGQRRESRPVSAPPAPTKVPVATEIRDWALATDRTSKGIRQAAARLLHEHPEVAAQRITNEHDDQEQLSVFLDRRARELDPPAESATSNELADRRRKRLFALFRDLGYDGPHNQQQRRSIAGRVLGREVTSMADVTDLADIEQLIQTLEGQKRQQGRQPIGATA
jgi:hypothetical protein